MGRAKGKNGPKVVYGPTITTLAWISFGFAISGGALIVDTWPGRRVAAIVELVPWGWTAAVLVFLAAVFIIRDLLLDWIPNRPAVVLVLLLPSVAAGAPGRAGDTVTALSNGLLRWVAAGLDDWVGTGADAGLAVTCVGIALLLAQRTVPAAPKAA